MKLLTAALALICLATASAQTQVSGIFDSNMALTSGADTQITFTGAGQDLILRLTATVTGGTGLFVKVHLETTTTLDATYSGFSALSLGLSGGVGFTITVGASSGTAAVVQMTLSSPALTPTIVSSVTAAGVIAGLVQYNVQSNAVVNLPIATQPTIASPRIVVNLPTVLVGTYIFATVTQTISVPYSTVANFYAQANQTVTYNYQSAKELAVTFRAKESATLKIDRSTTTTHSQPADGSISLGVYLTFTLGGNAAQNENHDSVIQYTYTDAQCAAVGISTAMQSNLRLAFYDTTAAKWQYPAGGYCDVQAKVVYQPTNHFSDWAVYYHSSAATAAGSLLLAAALAVATMLAH
jgi:hypothetical protein